MVSHVTAHMGSRHLDSPPTTCHNTLCLSRGLGPACGHPPHAPVCLVCECGRGRYQPRRLRGLRRQARNARCRVQAADPLTFAVSVGGWGVTGQLLLRSSESLLYYLMFPASILGAGLAPGRKGVKAAILTPPGDRSSRTPSCSLKGEGRAPRSRPERRSRGAGMGESAEVLEPDKRSSCPLAEVESAAP